MFEDEAGFGRINKPKYCWCFPGLRPTVPCHHIREYRYAYGAVEPLTGENFFLVLPYSNTDCMNVFLAQLSAAYPDDIILLACDGASWHRSNLLKIPPNMYIFISKSVFFKVNIQVDTFPIILPNIVKYLFFIFCSALFHFYLSNSNTYSLEYLLIPV